MRRAAAVVVALALVLGATPRAHAAPAGETEATAASELELGLAAYERGAFAEAMAHFERAYAREPSPATLYAWAQAARGADDCDKAIELYQRFLDLGATGDAREAARKNIERCRVIVAARPKPMPPTEPVPRPAVRDVAPPPEPTARRRADPTGLTLTIAGGVLVAGGVAIIGVAASDVARQSQTRDYQRFDRLDRRIDRLHLAGGVTLGVATALLVAGIVRLALVRRAARRR